MEIVKKNKKKHKSVWHFSQSNLQLFLLAKIALLVAREKLSRV